MCVLGGGGEGGRREGGDARDEVAKIIRNVGRENVTAHTHARTHTHMRMRTRAHTRTYVKHT